ncbi:MAG TPA: OmpA family protein [Bryobacterales bacterium]|nr:OmpA family protein [Bryobacterales bacterium]
MMRKCSLLLVFALGLAPWLFAAQGLSTRANKDDWEEINFEFNSSILSDGYPSLLRLAELLQKHPGYKVRLEGHTDYVGSDTYNNKLALARAETVKSFLVKYGVTAGRIETSGRGKRNPEVDNRTAEGRFMNRRVVVTVTDAQGKVISAGGVGEAIQAMEPAKKAEECCNEVLKKLDDIMAMLRDLKNENDDLKRQVAELKGEKPAPPPVAPAPPAAGKEEMAKMAEEAAQKAVQAGKTKKFSLLGLNAGPDTNGQLTFTGKGRFFAPFGGTHAVQAEGEYMRFADRQEGQADLGLVNRYKDVQLGLFSSFKRVGLRDYQQGGSLGQGALTFDWIFRRGRLGFFGTKAFLDNPVIGSKTISAHVFEESYLHVIDQIGGSTSIGLWGNAYVEGNLGALFSRAGSNRPGGTVRLIQPLNPHWAFTVEAGLNETLLSKNDEGRVAFGLQLGNWIRPKDFAGLKNPVPVDVPRIRYEVLTRRVRNGNSPPVADAGPDQLGVPAGTKMLDGSASYDPDGDPITFQWTQIAGPTVTLSNPTSAQTTFEAAAGQGYSFRLTVKDTYGGIGTAKVTVVTKKTPTVKIVRFEANPSTIKAGEKTTIVWEVQNATDVEITGLGKVDPKAGTSTVAPTETTMYKLTASNGSDQVSETITVTVARPDVRILSFQATPTNINAGQASTLSWQTENADTVSISGIGNVQTNGTAPVSPTQTTTYTLTATNRYGTVNATATVTVGPTGVPRIVRFAATPPEILPGEQSTLNWEVENASSITISGLGTVQATGTSAVSPATTTTYTLTATNAQGSVTATAVVSVLPRAKVLNFTANPPSTQNPGDPVTLTWTTQGADEVVITGVGNVPVNGSVVVKPMATTSYSLTAYGKRSQATAVVVVKVGAGFNLPPIADAGPPQIVGDPMAHLDGSRSYDPDGDPLIYSWRIISGQQVQITGANTATPAVKLLSGDGQYIFELTVADNRGASATATTRVTFKFDP